MLARRCEKCRSDACSHCQALQESPVQLRIFEFAEMTIDQRSCSHRLINCVKMTCTRTLSRTVWQQKNFRGHSAQVSPTRAKTNFSDESRSAIRMRACRRDGRVSGRDRRSMHPRTPRSRHKERCGVSRYGTFLDAELRFQEIVDGLRVGLAAGLLHHLADEPAGELRLGFRLRDLVRIGRNDVVDDLF